MSAARLLAVACLVSASARASPKYAQWPYREALEARIAEAEANVEAFRTEPREQPARKRFITGAAFSCTVCHQQEGAPAW
jgi:cytochrome c553